MYGNIAGLNYQGFSTTWENSPAITMIMLAIH